MIHHQVSDNKTARIRPFLYQSFSYLPEIEDVPTPALLALAPQYALIDLNQRRWQSAHMSSMSAKKANI